MMGAKSLIVPAFIGIIVILKHIIPINDRIFLKIGQNHTMAAASRCGRVEKNIMSIVTRVLITIVA